ALVRRDHAVNTAPPQLVDRPRRHVHLGALPRRLPGSIGLRVVERVRRDARPVALGMVGDMHEARTTGHGDEAGEALTRALLLVGGGQRGIGDRGEEARPQPRRVPRRLLRRAADQHHRRGPPRPRRPGGAPPPLAEAAPPPPPPRPDVTPPPRRPPPRGAAPALPHPPPAA